MKYSNIDDLIKEIGIQDVHRLFTEYLMLLNVKAAMFDKLESIIDVSEYLDTINEEV